MSVSEEGRQWSFCARHLSHEARRKVAIVFIIRLIKSINQTIKNQLLHGQTAIINTISTRANVALLNMEVEPMDSFSISIHQQNPLYLYPSMPCSIDMLMCMGVVIGKLGKR